MVSSEEDLIEGAPKYLQRMFYTKIIACLFGLFLVLLMSSWTITKYSDNELEQTRLLAPLVAKEIASKIMRGSF